MNLLRVRRLFAGEQVARFGTVGPGGHPRHVPVRFAVIDDGDEGVVACDLGSRPHSLAAARQMRHLAANPRVSFLVDREAQWWVEADAVAEVLPRDGADPRFARAAAALQRRYPDHPAPRTIVWATITSWAGWTVAAPAAA